MVSFDLYSVRFVFSARDPIRFGAGVPGNVLRGVLGSALRRIACKAECPGHIGKDVQECAHRAGCAYARIFEPRPLEPGPSGLANWPRPFVLRAAHLADQAFSPGDPFWFDVNLFDLRDSLVTYFKQAFGDLGAQGFGRPRSRADLISVQQLDRKGLAGPTSPISIPLAPCRTEKTHWLRVSFRTPTDLKGDGARTQPEFGVLFARARDRVSTLRSLYGAGPLEMDFRAAHERARAVTMTACHVREVRTRRRSSRTGQSHEIGGFVGEAQYEGDLTEFLPILEAAEWTGVGRHCVWGNGELRITGGDAL